MSPILFLSASIGGYTPFSVWVLLFVTSLILLLGSFWQEAYADIVAILGLLFSVVTMFTSMSVASVDLIANGTALQTVVCPYDLIWLPWLMLAVVVVSALNVYRVCFLQLEDAVKNTR